MGAITGLLGLGGGASGTGYSTTNSTNQNQVNNAYGQAQAANNQQATLLAALQGQGGLQNQSQVYNQLQGVANGTGPNPAQAMLNQATGTNVANQAALMAGQRGAASNPALIARQAAQQGANTQQQAVGQGATMQANQSLSALQQAGNIANTQASNQIGATTANTQAAQSEQSLLNSSNNANNSIQAGLAQTNMQGQQGLLGGVLGGVGTAIGLAQGGEVHKMAQGGQAGPTSSLGSFLSGWSGADQSVPQVNTTPNNSNISQNISSGFSAPTASTPLTDSGFTMPELGSQYATGQAPTIGGDYSFKAEGGDVGSKLKSGGHVPGKPKVPGNSYANDNVKALLSPGEVVIPNSIMQSKDPVRGAADFVAKVMAKKRMKNV